MRTALATMPDVESQLRVDEHEALGTMVDQLAAKSIRNQERTSYYDMRNLFRDLGIAIPPALRNLEVAMGWPAKAVDQLAQRVRFNKFVLPGGDVADWGIPDLWSENRMDLEVPKATVSTLINTPSFLFVSLGDTSIGEPRVVFRAFDATSATGVYDPVRRALSVALGIVSYDDNGEPNRYIMLTPYMAHGIACDDSRAWQVRSIPHGLGRVPVEPLVFRPRNDRPFGSSRISRAVMALTDSAMRTTVRAEVGAEFFSSPQRYLLGADEADFVGPNGERKSTWDLVMGKILAINRDNKGNVPEVGQFPQVSMQPHDDQMRMWATRFAGETGLPVSSLGIVQDNPASAEAIYAAKEDLILQAEACFDFFGPAYVDAMKTAIQMRDGLRAVPDDLKGLGVHFRDAATPSRAAASDAVMKQIQAGVLPADSDVALEQLGYDDVTIQRIQSDRRRTGGTSALQSILQRAAETQNPAPEATESPVSDDDGSSGPPATE